MNEQPETKQRKSINPGDIYQLGDHRLGCGSASDVEFVKKVAGGGGIRQILTDPPYGVAYGSGLAFKPGKHINGFLENDQLQDEDKFAEFTKKWIEAIKTNLDKYNTIYIFMSDWMMVGCRKGLKDAGGYYSQLIIWIKDHAFIGRKDYLPQHELIVYGWIGRHKRERSQGKSVLFFPKPHRSKLHPTMKPVGLLRQLILNSTKIGETVYDPFGGSGSTLIACEHLKRKCVMIELDTNYISTIIQRWEILTGQEAIKI